MSWPLIGFGRRRREFRYMIRGGSVFAFTGILERDRDESS
jgi:hypothetical protein